MLSLHFTENNNKQNITRVLGTVKMQKCSHSPLSIIIYSNVQFSHSVVMYNQTLCSVYIVIPQLRKISVIYFTILHFVYEDIFKRDKKEPLEKLTLIGRHTRHSVDSLSIRDYV